MFFPCVVLDRRCSHELVHQPVILHFLNPRNFCLLRGGNFYVIKIYFCCLKFIKGNLVVALAIVARLLVGQLASLGLNPVKRRVQTDCGAHPASY